MTIPTIKEGAVVAYKVLVIVALLIIALIAGKFVTNHLRKAPAVETEAPAAEAKQEAKEEKYPLGRVIAMKHGEDGLCYVSTENTVEPVVIDGCPVFIRDETASHRIRVTRTDDKGEAYGEAQICFALADICHKVH